MYNGTVLALLAACQIAASHDIFQTCYAEAEVLDPGFPWTATHQNSVPVLSRGDDIPFVFLGNLRHVRPWSVHCQCVD